MRLSHAFLWLAVLTLASCHNLEVPPLPEKGQVVGVLQGADATPLAGFEIELAPETGDSTRVNTGTDGSFSFTAVEPGPYTVRVSPEGYAELQRAITVVSRGTKNVGTLVLRKLKEPNADDGYLTGKVQIDTGASPLGAEVAFFDATTLQKIASLPVGLSGEFVQRLPPGTWRVVASHPLYVASPPLDVPLAAKETKALQPLSLAINPGIIEGTVLRSLDLSNATLPAAGAVITSDTNVTTTADNAGRFQLGMLAGGTRRLTITFPNHHDVVSGHAVEVTPGTTTQLGTVTLALDRGDVQGDVEMGDNSPLQDVTASLQLAFPDGGTNPYAVQVAPAGTRGTYVIRNVPVGDYAVRATRNNYIAATSGQVRISKDTVVSADPLRLFRIQGDFEIDDGDATNAPGFTRTQGLTLRLSNANNPTQYRVAENDPTLASASFVAFGADGGAASATNIPFSLATGDGTHTIFIQYRDGMGNLSGVLSGSVVLDTTAPVPDPVAPLVLENGADFTRQNVRLTAAVLASDPRNSGVDNVSGVGTVRLSGSNTLDGQGRLVGAAKPYGPGLQFDRTVTTDGPQTVYAQFIDNAGNASAVLAQDVVVVDTVAPTGSMTITRGARATVNGFTNDALVALNFSVAAEPNGGFVLVKRANDVAADLSGATQQAVQSTMSWLLTPSEGLRTVHYRLVDAAGNEATNASQSITLDTTPPVGSLTLASPALTNSLTQTLVVGATDLNGLSPTQALTLSEELSFASAGTVGPSALPGSNPTFTLSAGEGLRTVYARYRDVAGNDSTVGALVQVDQTPPAGTISLEGTLADNTVSTTLTSAASVTVRFQPADAVEYLLGDENLITCPATGYTTLPANNTVTGRALSGAATPREVRACLRDAAKNARRADATIRLDSSTPTGCTFTVDGKRADNVTSSGASKTASRTVTVTLANCSEPPVDLFLTEGTATCTAATANDYQPFRASLPFTIAGADGPITLRGCVRDAARNTGTVTGPAITLDTQPPSAASISINAGATWINKAQTTGTPATSTTLTVGATVSGATEWALSTTGTPSTFSAIPGTNSTTLPLTLSGDGLYTVYAAFRDDVGNTTQATITDTILVDATPPDVTGMSLSIPPSGAAGFVNTEAIAVTVNGAPDAVDAFLTERLAVGNCVSGDFTNSPRQSVVNTYTFVMAPQEVRRQICVKYRDAAGNDSIGGPLADGVLRAGVTLDKTPPSTPQIVTADQFLRLPDSAPFAVDISTVSSDLNGFSYQRSGGIEDDGGVNAGWSNISPAGPATRFAFRVRNDGSELGVRNEFRLRALDVAGNASGESVVYITADTNAPSAVEVSSQWVDNADSRGVVYFKKPQAQRDAEGIAGLHVYYSSDPNFSEAQVASFAAEGPSPLTVPIQNSVTLSGLPNGTPTWVRIKPFDQAGNEDTDGGTGWTGIDGGAQSPIRVQPDEVSSNEINSLILPSGQDLVRRMAMHDSVLYVLAQNSFCTINFQFYLHAVNTRQLIAPIQNGKITTPPPPVVNSTLTLTGNTIACDAAQTSGDLVIEGNWAFVTTQSHLFIVNISEPLVPTLYATIDLTGFEVGTNFSALGLQSFGDRLAIGGQRQATATIGTFAGMWNLAKLYDRNSATVPLASDRLAYFVNATEKPSAVAFTRDRMMAFGSNSLLYRYDLSPALATAAAAPTSDGLTAFPLRLFARPPVSGNLMYLATPNYGLTANTLSGVWAGGDPGAWLTTTPVGATQLDMAGHLVYLPETSARGLRIVDVSSRSAPRAVGINAVASGLPPTHVVSFGNYAITANGSTLRFFETATPRALANTLSVANSGSFPKVVGGFVYTGARVIDLQGGVQPPLPDVTVTTCWNGASYGDGFEVEGRGDGFATRNLDTATDRSTLSFFSSSNDVLLAAGTRVTDVEVWGNYIVAAEVRTTGVWLEVFDARKLKNRAGNVMSTADSVGSLQIVAIASPPSSLFADLSIVAGRAAVGLDTNNGTSIVGAATGNNLYFAELKGLFDDDITTVGGPVHGPVVTHQVRQVAMQGNTAYVATTQGVRIIDITNVMDSNPATLLPASPATASILDGNWIDGVYVSGSMLLTTPAYTASNQPLPSGVYSIDVSNPSAPEVQGFYPRFADLASCTPAGDVSARYVRLRITASGNRAYFNTAAGDLQILQLE